MALRLLPFKRALAARQVRRQQTLLPALGYSSTRPKSDTSHPNPQRDAQLDREKMDTQSNEYSKSGTDTDAAEQNHVAFDSSSPNDPEEAKKQAGKGNEVNPLDASPANPELSSGTSEESSGAGKKRSQEGGDSSGDKH